MDLKGQLINLKPIPIYFEGDSYHLSKKEMHCIKKIKCYEAREAGLYLSNSVSVLENTGLKNLKKFLIGKAESYVKNILEIENKIYLTQSWSTLNKLNGHHSAHYHPNTFIGLAYYAEAEKGDLYFDLRTSSLKEGFNFDYSITKYNIYNSEQWTLHVKTGDLVIFPGHVCHGATANKSNSQRIMMGANFFLKGKIGREDRISNIEI